jgi:hypothetical protein
VDDVRPVARISPDAVDEAVRVYEERFDVSRDPRDQE